MQKNERIQAVCPVCDLTGAHVISKYRGHHAIFSPCSIVRCDSCNMVFVYPMPDEAALHAYNHSYFSNAHGGISTNRITVAFHSAINLLRVLHVEKFRTKESKQVTKVLEIGPGPGNFAKHWLERNKETIQYTAVESDPICYSSLADLGVTVYGEIEEIKDRSFDLVVISHVLEHTSGPKKFLHSCTDLLSPGGILFIEVPCNDHEHKDTVEPHLLFFDKGPMKLLLEKTGFGHVQLSYHGNKITDLKKAPSVYKRLLDKFRNRLLGAGIVSPFSVMEPGMEGIHDPLERASVKPFKAHIEQSEPSWWLRAIAIKN
jgi:SAM-dependent methyltransferase